MSSDLDVYRTASILIREYVEDVDLVAAQRTDGFLGPGDMEARPSGAGS